MDAGASEVRSGRAKRVTITLVLVLLFVLGLVDVRKRARIDPASPAAHRSDVTVYTGAGAAFFTAETDPYVVRNPRGWHYLYPPLFALAVAPLNRLPGSEQGLVFYLISLLLLYGSLAETSRLVSLAVPGVRRVPWSLLDPVVPRWIVWCAVLAVLFPLLNCLQRGQLAPFTLYPLLLGTRMLIARRSWGGFLAAGVVLALPVAIKLTPLLPVAYVGWFLWLRVPAAGSPGMRGRFLAASGLTAGVLLGLVVWLLLVPAALVGWRANLDHLETWVDRVAANRSVDEENDFFGASRRNQSFQNGARLLVGTFRDEPGAQGVDAPGKRYRSELNAAEPLPALDRGLFVVRVAMILLLLAGGLRLARSGQALDLSAALGLGTVGSVVFSPLSWGHHYGIVWPAVVFVPLLAFVRGRLQTARMLAFAFAGIVLAHYLFTGPVGSLGLLGIGTAVWLVAAIVTLPSGADAGGELVARP